MCDGTHPEKKKHQPNPYFSFISCSCSGVRDRHDRQSWRPSDVQPRLGAGMDPPWPGPKRRLPKRPFTSHNGVSHSRRMYGEASPPMRSRYAWKHGEVAGLLRAAADAFARDQDHMQGEDQGGVVALDMDMAVCLHLRCCQASAMPRAARSIPEQHGA